MEQVPEQNFEIHLLLVICEEWETHLSQFHCSIIMLIEQ